MRKFSRLIFLLIFISSQNVKPQFLDFRISETGNAVFNPVIANDSLGNFIAVWADGRLSGYPNGDICGTGIDIYAQLFTDKGEFNGTNFKVTDDYNASSCSYASQAFPSVDMNNKGDFIIVWQDNRSDHFTEQNNFRIYGQYYENGGRAKGENFLISEDDSDSKTRADVLLWDDGSYIVLWMENIKNKSLEIVAQQYNERGEKVNKNSELKIYSKQYKAVKMDNENFIIATYTNVYLYSKNLVQKKVLDITLGSDIDIAYDSTSNKLFVVTSIEQTINNFATYDVTLQSLDINNNFKSDIIKINDDATYYWQHDPKIAIENDKIIVVWTDYRNGYEIGAGKCRDIYAQRFDTFLNKIGNNIKLSHETNISPQQNPDVILSNNIIIAVWLDGRSLEYFPVFPPEIKTNIWGTKQNYFDPHNGIIIPCLTEESPSNNSEIIYNFFLYPNPAKNIINISFELHEEAIVQVILYNAIGEQLRILYEGSIEKKYFFGDFSVSSLCSGVYIVSVCAFNNGKRNFFAEKILIIE